MFCPLNVAFFYSKLLLDNSASFTIHIIKDEKLLSILEGKN